MVSSGAGAGAGAAGAGIAAGRGRRLATAARERFFADFARFLVVVAFRPAVRILRDVAVFLAAARRLRATTFLFAGALRFLLAAAFFAIHSSSHTIARSVSCSVVSPRPTRPHFGSFASALVAAVFATPMPFNESVAANTPTPT
jgi:hypothetical protein